MTALIRVLIFVPVAFLVMVVYVAPRASSAAEVLRLAVPKTGKLVMWTVVLIVVMQLIQWLFLP